MSEAITVSVQVHGPIEKVWDAFTDPEAIKVWNAASDDWHTTAAKNDVRVGGTFSSRMEAKDGSEGFDFEGTYTTVDTHKRIAYTMNDGRTAETTFKALGEDVVVTTVFDAEEENSAEMQRTGWQAILDNFKAYVEGLETGTVGSAEGNSMAVGIAVGVALGAGIGVALGNIGMGVGIGIALGVAFGASGVFAQK